MAQSKKAGRPRESLQMDRAYSYSLGYPASGEAAIQTFVRRFGRSVREATARLRSGWRVDRQPQQVEAKIAARTADGTPVELAIAVHYSVPLHYGVLPQNADDAFGELNEAHTRIDGAISEAVLACVPKLKLADLVANRDEIASTVKSELEPLMLHFGYEILDAVVVGIRVSDPAPPAC